MTLATLDQLFGDVPPSHEHLERFGYREDKVRGRSRYVGRDDNGRAVIGPVRHRAKGLLSFGRKKKTKQLPVQERTMKFIIDPKAIDRLTAEANRAIGRTSEAFKTLNTVDFSKLGTPVPPTPPQKENGMIRFGRWLTELWYDEDWHRGARNTAGTVLMWSFTVFALVTFGKGMLWVISL
jgi:hypothetical protein